MDDYDFTFQDTQGSQYEFDNLSQQSLNFGGLSLLENDDVKFDDDEEEESEFPLFQHSCRFEVSLTQLLWDSLA